MRGLPFLAAATMGLAVLRGAVTPFVADAAAAEAVIEPSGVTLVAPPDAVCPPIALPFAGAPRDGDGRRARPHEGVDLEVPAGTPVLAIAAGKVIGVVAGARSTGHAVWLQHGPDDTGRPYWTYSAYRHLAPVPHVEVGSEVKMGHVIGTAGTARYPHFHFETTLSESARYEARRTAVVIAGGRLVDPAVLYVSGFGGPMDLERLSRTWPSVLLPYATPDGVIHPKNARVIWPLACRRR